MRTSRVARETSRAVNAMSAQRSSMRQAQAKSLQSYAFGASSSASAGVAVKKEEGDESDSGLSSVPSDFETGRQSDSELSSVPSDIGNHAPQPPPRKRKRVSKTTIIKTENSPQPALTASSGVPTTAPKAKKARRAPAKKTTAPASNTSIKTEPPPDWETVYALTAAMRARIPAPVDTMGCETLAESTRSPLDQRLQTLIALMLSAQTKDTVTAAAMTNLQANLVGGFNLDALRATDQSTLNTLIEKVGFHNNKAKYIKQTAELLATRFSGDIPDSIEGLTSLPGVGPKMAYLCMSAAWGRDEGIGVDVHVHRITNLWGWHQTRTPEETRKALESWLPRDKWHAINHLLVGFGQTVCLPVGRRCGECGIAERGLCPGAVVGKKVGRKREGVAVKKEDGVVGGEQVKEEVEDVKAEDLEDGVVDIEDLGGARATRSRRA